MQESKSPTPVRHLRMNQARSEEEEKRDRGQETDGGKKGSPTKQNLSEELKKAYLGTAQVNEEWEECLTFLVTECDPLLTIVKGNLIQGPQGLLEAIAKGLMPNRRV